MAVAVAPSTVRWTARAVAKHHVPKLWGDFVNDDLIRLKDTHNPGWKNRLLSPNTFLYLFPTHSFRSAIETEFVHRLMARVATRRPLRVQLFSTPGSRDETYGEWVVQSMNVERGELRLLRLQCQPDEDEYHSSGHRSKNEEEHHRFLETIFSSDAWTVVHEPETIVDLHDPTVVDGVPTAIHEGLTRSYTCDFVVSHKVGCARLCVESKPTVDHATEVAKIKCRRLRDRTRTRVLMLCGTNAQENVWYDFGPPGSEDERWICTMDELRTRLQL